MAIRADSNFESDALNASPPAGFYVFNLGGSVQHGGDPNPVAAGGDHCFQFSASGGVGVGPAQGLPWDNSVTINFSLKNLLNAGLSTLLISVNNLNNITLTGAQLVAIGYNADGTFYMSTGSVFVCASTDTFILDEWMFIQVDLDFSAVTVMGTQFLAVSGDIILDGKVIASSGMVITSSIPVANLFNNLTASNDYEFSPPGFLGGLIDNITIQTPSNPGTPIYPHGGSPRGRLTQSVVEVTEVPTNSFVRLTQGAVEVSEVPSTAFLRLTQAVIELPTIGGGAGWEIYEA
jgi:hypothetical protein